MVAIFKSKISALKMQISLQETLVLKFSKSYAPYLNVDEQSNSLTLRHERFIIRVRTPHVILGIWTLNIFLSNSRDI